VLEAIGSAPPQALAKANDYTRALSRGACSSGVERLKVECLMTAARRYCRQKDEAETRRCSIYMDVVISNVLGDPQLISVEKRYQIMKRDRDYRRALAIETRRIQGALALDFRLRMGAADDNAQVAANLDRFCLLTADETNLAWQTCVSSLVWFMRASPAVMEANEK
jgi:hypothetical protein